MNEVYKVFDERISYFDVYKVESINEKYMVASGVPQPNGKKNSKMKSLICPIIWKNNGFFFNL